MIVVVVDLKLVGSWMTRFFRDVRRVLQAAGTALKHNAD